MEQAKQRMSEKQKHISTIEDLNTMKSADDIFLKLDKSSKKKQWMADGILSLILKGEK